MDKEIRKVTCKNCKYNSEDNAWCLHESMNWRDAYVGFPKDDDTFVRDNCPFQNAVAAKIRVEINE